MSTINTEQLNRPIKDLRRVTIRFSDGIIIEYQTVVEKADNLHQKMARRFSNPGIDTKTGKKLHAPLSSIMVAKPLGFRRDDGPDAADIFCWDEKNEECVWSSPENQRRLTVEFSSLTTEERKRGAHLLTKFGGRA